MSKNRNYRTNNYSENRINENHIKPTDVENTDLLEEDTIETKIGTVIGCQKLNVRKESRLDSPIVCIIDCQTELTINEKESTEDFYKVSIDMGTEGFNGYCMKKFITVQP